jgi:hypothetical protein
MKDDNMPAKSSGTSKLAGTTMAQQLRPASLPYFYTLPTLHRPYVQVYE